MAISQQLKSSKDCSGSRLPRRQGLEELPKHSLTVVQMGADTLEMAIQYGNQRFQAFLRSEPRIEIFMRF